MQVETLPSGLIYVVDAYYSSWCPGVVPFLVRQALCVTLVTHLSSVVSDLHANEFFVPTCSSDLIWIQLKSAHAEGLVLSPLAPHFVAPYSDIRYVKAVYTIDVASPSGIVEVIASTSEKVRKRPDKTKPNSFVAAQEILKAPPLSVVWETLLRTADTTPLSTEELNVASSLEHSMSRWDPIQLSSFLYRRSVFTAEVMNRVASGVVDAYDTAAFDYYQEYFRNEDAFDLGLPDNIAPDDSDGDDEDDVPDFALTDYPP
jgi:hypothetical protein